MTKAERNQAGVLGEFDPLFNQREYADRTGGAQIEAWKLPPQEAP